MPPIASSPKSTKPIASTEDMEIGKEVSISQRGPEPQDLVGALPDVEVVSEKALRKDWMDLEAFMQEELEVFVQEPQNPDLGEQWIIPLTVGTITQRVARGVPQKIKRKYVEILCRARKVGIVARGYKDQTGEAVNDFRRNSRSLEYPFQVLHDPSGKKGIEWLQRTLRDER